MSLWSPAARKAYTQRTTLKSTPRTDLPQKPAAPKPSPAKAQQARYQDSFTPSSPRGPSRRPELNPEPVRHGHSSPVSPSHVGQDARETRGGTGVLTINIASGAGPDYTDPKNREAQAELIRQTDASIIAFQEVDVNVERSGDVNTALDIIARVDERFRVFIDGDVPTHDINDPLAPVTSIREGADGTTLYQSPAGTLVTGESFSTDNRAIGDDRGDENATYGNAIFVAPPQQVSEAYTVALPSLYDPNTKNDRGPYLTRGASPEELAALADGKLTEAERNRLMRDNERIRDLSNSGDASASEPRSALVTRVTNPDGTEQTLINVHIAVDPKELREAQLRYVAELAAAESKGPPEREVVLMGDFNAYASEVEPIFREAGLERVVGGDSDSHGNIDQIWTTSGVNTRNSAQVETEVSYDPNPNNSNTTERETRDVTDHEYAGYTEIF
ncbi:endonuclease/exonuclease/phosphatase family protein [Pyxidicoccus sp. 3LG]